MEALEDKRVRLQPECKKRLNDRIEMWSYAAKVMNLENLQKGRLLWAASLTPLSFSWVSGFANVSRCTCGTAGLCGPGAVISRWGCWDTRWSLPSLSVSASETLRIAPLTPLLAFCWHVLVLRSLLSEGPRATLSTRMGEKTPRPLWSGPSWAPRLSWDPAEQIRAHLGNHLALILPEQAATEVHWRKHWAWMLVRLSVATTGGWFEYAQSA